MRCISFLLLPGCTITICLINYIYLYHPPLPILHNDAWWGPDNLTGKQDTSVRPFKIRFDDDMVKDLKHRLRSYRPSPPPLGGVGFEYGFNTKELQNWVNYWAEGYNFTQREKEMNRYPHFKTNIQGLDVHFMRIRPEAPSGIEVIPMLIIHGWPGSIKEFYGTIPHLTSVSQERDFALEVIAPSLPGFGYSDGSVRTGLGLSEMAVILKNLMRRLGFKKFYIQGGDIGSIIGSIMATLYPAKVLGFHTNLVIKLSLKSVIIASIFSFYPTLLLDEAVVDRLYPLTNFYSFLLQESGYFNMHSTKPDTIGITLADSPAGVLAYIVEKFSRGTNKAYIKLPDGGIGRHYSKDQILDNVMMYWVPNTFTTSARVYKESVDVFLRCQWDDIPTSVPTWALQAEHEIAHFPPSVLRLKYPKLLGTTVLHKGGHFLALEEPEAFAEDVLKAVEEFRKYWRENKVTKVLCFVYFEF